MECMTILIYFNGKQEYLRQSAVNWPSMYDILRISVPSSVYILRSSHLRGAILSQRKVTEENTETLALSIKLM